MLLENADDKKGQQGMPDGLVLTNGELKVRIDKTFALEEAAEAHRQLEARKTTGKVLLIP